MSAAPGLRALRVLLLAGLSALAAGCATTNPADPLEPYNRRMFAFNQELDRRVLVPVATTYRDVVPGPVRTGVNNFFSNIGDAWSTVNSVLQLKLEPAARNGMRFAINTVLGLGGLLDIATEAGLEPQDEDFGQTLGRWGIGAGPYIVLPALGPSTLRDTAALPLDMQASGYAFRHDDPTRYSLTGLRVVDTRAQLLGATRVLDQVALDPYLFVRDAYLQRRRNQVHDGNPPDTEDDYEYEPEEAPAPAAQ